MEPLSEEEANFSIAFNLIAHEDFERLERLMRVIYHPQNQYCIHIDAKASKEMADATNAFARCFDNVFMVTKRERIVYAGFSRLQADINCMRDHLSFSSKWKYLLNTASTGVPLKTNAELVQILKIYNGANDIEGIYGEGEKVIKNRFATVWIEDEFSMKKTNISYVAPPHDIGIVKGSAYGAFSRDFVSYALTDQKALDLLEWSKKTYSPDEHYWATLHHIWPNPHLNPPGGFRGQRSPILHAHDGRAMSLEPIIS